MMNKSSKHWEKKGEKISANISISACATVWLMSLSIPCWLCQREVIGTGRHWHFIPGEKHCQAWTLFMHTLSKQCIVPLERQRNVVLLFLIFGDLGNTEAKNCLMSVYMNWHWRMKNPSTQTLRMTEWHSCPLHAVIDQGCCYSHILQLSSLIIIMLEFDN